ASDAGLSNLQIADVIEEVTAASEQIADPADLAAAAVIETGASSSEALEIAAGAMADDAAEDAGLSPASTQGLKTQLAELETQHEALVKVVSSTGWHYSTGEVSI
ncbi:hypothetical protein DYB32_010019, partial [Aphanomyces invadans]